MLIKRGGLSQFWSLVVNVMRQHGLSRQFQTVNTLVQSICLIIWVNHLGGCLWRYVGREAIASWYKDMGIEDTTRGFDYLLSYYWSVSALVAGENIMDVTRSSEVFCTCVFILFGLLFVSILISSLAATVMDFHMSNKERSDKLRILRQYFYQHQVEAPVAIPIEKQVLERMGGMKRIGEKDVEVLSFLSPAMRAELWFSVYGPGIYRNAFIRAVSAVDGTVIKDLCFNERGLLQATYDPGTNVFEPDTDAPGAYFLNWGALEYTIAWAATEASNGTGATGNTRVHSRTQEVVQGQWVCELALHTQWRQLGGSVRPAGQGGPQCRWPGCDDRSRRRSLLAMLSAAADSMFYCMSP